MDPVSPALPALPALPGAVRAGDRGGSPAARAARLDEAVEHFEALFLRQIVKGLRKTAKFEEESAFMTGMYSEMLDEQVADHLAKAGGLGLAAVIRAYVEGARK
jgi:Rod binding domain-containing protein